MWIKTSRGMINLAHAFDMAYDPSSESLAVWWTFPLPADVDGTEMANVHDLARLAYYVVKNEDWAYFSARTFPTLSRRVDS